MTTDDRSFGGHVRTSLQLLSSQGELGKVVGPGLISALAQSEAGGLSIENIRRGMLVLTSDATAAMTVDASTSGFAALSTPLSGEMMLSGRPLMVMVAGIVSVAGGGIMYLDVQVRRQSVTGLTTGLPGCFTASASAVGVNGWWPVVGLTPGRATVELVADAITGDGSIYVDSGKGLSLLAVEL